MLSVELPTSVANKVRRTYLHTAFLVLLAGLVQLYYAWFGFYLGAVGNFSSPTQSTIFVNLKYLSVYVNKAGLVSYIAWQGDSDDQLGQTPFPSLYGFADDEGNYQPPSIPRVVPALGWTAFSFYMLSVILCMISYKKIASGSPFSFLWPLLPTILISTAAILQLSSVIMIGTWPFYKVVFSSDADYPFRNATNQIEMASAKVSGSGRAGWLVVTVSIATAIATLISGLLWFSTFAMIGHIKRTTKGDTVVHVEDTTNSEHHLEMPTVQL